MGICPWLCAHRPVTPPWLWRLFLIALPIWLRQWVFCPRMSHPDHDNSTSQTHSQVHSPTALREHSLSHTDTHTESERDRDFKHPFVLSQTSSLILHSKHLHPCTQCACVQYYELTSVGHYVIYFVLLSRKASVKKQSPNISATPLPSLRTSHMHFLEPNRPSCTNNFKQI